MTHLSGLSNTRNSPTELGCVELWRDHGCLQKTKRQNVSGGKDCRCNTSPGEGASGSDYLQVSPSPGFVSM